MRATIHPQNAPVNGARATSSAQAAKLLGKLFVADEIATSVASYRAEPTDIIISPYSKCGTTWLQQIFHTLRSGGDETFDDISRVVPWIEMAGALEIDINAPQTHQPRGFKSHLDYARVPQGAKYVVCLREPKDAFVSLFRFMEGWFIEPGAIGIEEFAQGWLFDRDPQSGYWGHLLSWWEQRNNPHLLLLCYRHMLQEPEQHIRTLAEFIGLPLSNDLLALTLERSSLDYMLAHKNKFDDALMRRKSEERCGLPPGSDAAKVRVGGVNTHAQVLPAKLVQRIDAVWQERITPITGHSSYAALEADILSRASP